MRKNTDMKTLLHKDKKEKPERKPVKSKFGYKLSGIALLLLLIYFIYGYIGPYIADREVNRAYRERFSTTGFYASENDLSPDYVQLLTTAPNSETALLNCIEQANSGIWLTIDSLPVAETSEKIGGALLSAAEREVKVQILVDGRLQAAKSPLLQTLASHDNIEIREYRPLNYLKPWTYNSKLNDRFLISDDQLAWFSESTDCSRLNKDASDVRSSDWNLLIYNKAANSRDTAYSVLSELRNYHTALWNSPEAGEFAAVEATDIEYRNKLINDWAALLEENTSYSKKPESYLNDLVPTERITLVKNPLSDTNKEPYVWFQIQSLMADAEERVYVQTPYILLSANMYKDMEAIKANIADVTVLTHAVANQGNYKEIADYRINRSKVINTGVQLKEYQGESPFVPKVTLIDRNLTILGSYQYNQASTYLNTESVLVIQSEKLNQQITTLSEEIAKESLMVKPDGTYNEVAQVQPLPDAGGRGFLQFLAGLGLQLFRSVL